MIVLCDTTSGRKRFVVRNIRQVARLLRILQDASESDLRAGRAPRFKEAGLRYRREGRMVGGSWQAPANEDWMRATRAAEAGFIDCEEASTYYAADLVVSGEDPRAQAVCYESSGETVHCVTARGNGAIEDPSRALGMGSEANGMKEDRLRWRIRRVRGGCELEISIPFEAGGETRYMRVLGRGRNPVVALHDVLCKADAGLREAGINGFDFQEIAEIGVGDAEFEQWVARTTLQYNEFKSEYSDVAGRVLSTIGSINWSDWSDNPQAFATTVVNTIVGATAALGGPAAPLVSAMMAIGEWLCGEYPAVAEMRWQGAFVKCADGLGYTDPEETTRVAKMLQDGWICADLKRQWSRIEKPDGTRVDIMQLDRSRGEGFTVNVLEPEQYRDALVACLAPRSGDPTRPVSARQRWQGTATDWAIGSERVAAIEAASALQYLPIRSSDNRDTIAVALKLGALPVDVIDALALYLPNQLGGRPDEIKRQGIDPKPADEGVWHLIGWMMSSGFDASGGGQGFTGFNTTHYLKVLSDLRPGMAPASRGMSARIAIKEPGKQRVGIRRPGKGFGKLALPLAAALLLL